MATSIYNYDGTLLTTVADGSIDTTSASIKFPGRGYVNYGQPINENLLWMLQNFASPTAPANPVNGQAWFDTANSILKLYDASVPTWITAGGVIASATAPIGSYNRGAFWYDTTKNQLYVWNGSNWLLLAPLGASDGLDPINPSVPSYSQLDAVMLTDDVGDEQNVWRIMLDGSIIAIFSAAPIFTPDPVIDGFTTIRPGLNLNSSISGVGVSGDATVFRSVQTNLPSVSNTWDMGSNTFRFATMWANVFDGTATAARYADVAERYEADSLYEPGTVVKLGGDKEITATVRSGDDEIFGVVSTNPAVLMNSAAGSNDTHPPVALTGRVPCKVVGQIRKGQRLMSSDLPGVACAWDSMDHLSILGRAIEEKNTNEVGMVEIVVGKN